MTAPAPALATAAGPGLPVPGRDRVPETRCRGWRPPPALETVHVAPGECHVTTEPILLRTLLGSCVSACLYDPVHRVAGMNHFLLSACGPGRRPPLTPGEAGRYGPPAMEWLVDEMLRRGARRADLRAKAFGGGAVLGRTADKVVHPVGEGNGRFLREFLRAEGIPLVAAGLGGEWGRVIYFSAVDFSVHARRIRGRESPEPGRRARGTRGPVCDGRPVGPGRTWCPSPEARGVGGEAVAAARPVERRRG